MRLLLDENLSRRLVPGLTPVFQGSAHVQELGLLRAEDADVWAAARQRGFTIVSKDDDFYYRSMLLGHPPKVIWLQLGNCSTREVLDVLLAATERILAFGNDPEQALMVLGPFGSLRY